MITLCIRYTIDQNQYRNFEEYVRALPEPIRRSGGELDRLLFANETRRADEYGSRADQFCES